MRPARRTSLLTLVGPGLAVLGFVAGCATPSEPEATAPGPVTASRSATPSASPVEQPPTAAATQTGEPSASPSPTRQTPATLRFSAKTTDGTSFDGSSLQGKPVLLWFWAPWCPTCQRELPEVEKLAKRYGGDVHVVGVGSLDSAAAINRFADQTSGFTANLADQEGSVWKHFKITQQSSFVLLDADGQETFRTGYGGSPDLADEVAAVAE
jgi:thiol-disulfide isomerase/thioredoxin